MTTSANALHRTSARYRAMGTDIEMIVIDDDQVRAHRAIADARRELDRLAAIFTRFDPGSELSMLNETRKARCSPELVEVTQLALEARTATAGRFDPTILRALLDAGYDEDFDIVHARARRPDASPRRMHRPGAVLVDASSGLITLEEDCLLDLGGIAKGWIVDQVLQVLGASSLALVNAGGDIAVTEHGDEKAWTITVPTPDGDMVAGVERGGIATSGTDRRWWIGADGARLHHVIDPSTGRPAITDLVRVTVFDDSGCSAAEVDATRLLLTGASGATREAAALGITAILVAADDSVTRTGALA